jgi:hypothetical protein
MTRLPLLPQARHYRERYLDSQALPDNYMEDFSLMGLLVNDFTSAADTLESAGFTLSQGTGSAEVTIDSPDHLKQAVALLEAHAIDCTLTDIADSLYQA